jgi:hypothetical protein
VWNIFHDDLLPGLVLLFSQEKGWAWDERKMERRDGMEKCSEKRERGEDGQGMGEKFQEWNVKNKRKKVRRSTRYVRKQMRRAS